MQDKACHMHKELILYLAGECTQEEAAIVREHLNKCASCLREWNELRQVWETLPLMAEETSPPDDLKAEVMSALFAKPEKEKFAVQSPQKRRRWVSGIAAAFVLGIALGSLWNVNWPWEQNRGETAQLNRPTEVVRQFALKAADPSFPSVNGTAWVVRQGKKCNIVVEMKGLPATTGEQVFQVWLIRQGRRYNGGVLQEDGRGNAVLTGEVDPQLQDFEAIGVTLEPDPNGRQPRGKKILGT